MTSPPILLDEMTSADWPSVRAIYEQGIATGDATFETEVPPWEQWDAAHLKICRLVARSLSDFVLNNVQTNNDDGARCGNGLTAVDNSALTHNHPASSESQSRPSADCARRSSGILGWAALSPVSSRCVYAGVAEVSVYVAARARGHRIGSELLRALIEASEREGLWTLQAGILSENTASLHLHEQQGFRRVGLRERLGCLRGRWRDVVLMERRSPIVGV